MAQEETTGKFEMLEARELDQDIVRITETILSQNTEIIKMNNHLLAVLLAPLQMVGWREVD